MEMPQIVMIVLVVINLMVNFKNGDSQQFFATVLDSCVLLGVLYWGGFFN